MTAGWYSLPSQGGRPAMPLASTHNKTRECPKMIRKYYATQHDAQTERETADGSTYTKAYGQLCTIPINFVAHGREGATPSASITPPQWQTVPNAPFRTSTQFLETNVCEVLTEIHLTVKHGIVACIISRGSQSESAHRLAEGRAA